MYEIIFQGGRYKIIREEKKGAVDTNLIIQNIAYNDNFSRSTWYESFRIFIDNYSSHSDYWMTIIQNIASMILFPGQKDKSDEFEFDDCNDGCF